MIQRKDRTTVLVKMRGTRPGKTELSHEHPNEFHFVIERVRPHLTGVDQWETNSNGITTAPIGTPDPNDSDLLCIQTITHKDSIGLMRLVVREYEWLNVDKDVNAGTFEPCRRLVFADVLELPGGF